jgi:hypothetical protein
MTEIDVRATVLKTHNDHGIACPGDTENKLVRSLQELQAEGKLTKADIGEVANQMPTRFFESNGLDSPNQYARLLWEGISVASTRPQQATGAQTNFYGPVSQTGIFQTGAKSTAQWFGNNQILAFRQEFTGFLAEARKAAEAELSADQKEHALAIIDVATEEAAKSQPDRSRLKRLLTPMLKWTGDRFTKAIDAAVGAVIASSLTPRQ